MCSMFRSIRAGLPIVAKMVKRAYRYRFYPTSEQAEELSRTFGCVRLVYNKALEERIHAYRVEGERTSYAQSPARLAAWKRTKELSFLSEVSCVPLRQALRHLHVAFGNPAFKSRKRSRASAEYTRSAFRWRGGRLTRAKMDAPLDIVWSRPLPKGSGNRARAKQVVARIQARTADRRRDHSHKVTTRLVRENQVIAVEDLNVASMVKNRSLARTISDAGWRELRSTLADKAAWYGRELIVVDRWFPSSKRCSACGASHDRDVNAAENILAAGLAER